MLFQKISILLETIGQINILEGWWWGLKDLRNSVEQGGIQLT